MPVSSHLTSIRGSMQYELFEQSSVYGDSWEALFEAPDQGRRYRTTQHQDEELAERFVKTDALNWL